MKMPVTFWHSGFAGSLEEITAVFLKAPDGSKFHAEISPKDGSMVEQLLHASAEFGILTGPTTVQVDFGELEFPKEKFQCDGMPRSAYPGEPVQVVISKEGAILGVVSLLHSPPPVRTAIEKGKAEVEGKSIPSTTIRFTPPNPDKWVPAAIATFQRMVQRSINSQRGVN